jgi:hypothetical protein
MATWKKWVIGSAVTFFVLAAMLVAAVLDGLDRLSDEMCATTIFDQSASQNGKVKAVLYQVDCGATTGFNRHVSIVSVGADLTKKNPELGPSPFALRGMPEVKLAWLSSGHLEVQYPEGANVLRAESKSNGVAIEYKKSR